MQVSLRSQPEQGGVLRPLRRVLIANRGEIAVRIASTLRELGIVSIAVYSDADVDASHVRACDLAVRVGPAAARESYLKVEAILAAARQTHADAIHPGYGFLSENADFAEAVRAAGRVFIGPSVVALRTMGSKTRARAAMQTANVPVVPGTVSALREVGAASALAEQMGYPIMLKAAAGGGGKGMRLVERPEELAAALRSASSEAASAFGDDAVYMEKALLSPRHIELQIFADAHGRCVALGERECSMQRRHQKILEEAPSAVLTEPLRARMGEVACRAATAVDYVGAGTVEFLLDERNDFYFLEMNTRLQVEHPVTESVFGIDLVAAQIAVASGGALPWAGSDLVARGHAIEARVYAEDPERGFLPAPGRLRRLRWPQGPGVRVDSGVAEGCEISSHYDPMLAKIVVWAPSRAHACARLARALDETRLQGIATNLAFLRRLVASPAFAAGHYHTGTVAEVLAQAPPAPSRETQVVAAIAATLSRQRASRGRGQAAAAAAGRSRWQEGWR